MKKLDLLHKLITLIFVINIIYIALMPGFVLIHFVSPDMVPENVKIDIHESIIHNAVSVIRFIGYLLAVLGLYLFRKVLGLLQKRRIFDNEVIKLFKQIGQCVVAGVLLSAVPPFIYHLVVEQTFGFEDTDLGVLINLCMGLFFIVLSEVFKMAKAIKEENDLTL